MLTWSEAEGPILYEIPMGTWLLKPVTFKLWATPVLELGYLTPSELFETNEHPQPQLFLNMVIERSFTGISLYTLASLEHLLTGGMRWSGYAKGCR